MFGRDLIEQVREDSKNSKNSELVVPIIVEKCIEAVEANGMLSRSALFVDDVCCDLTIFGSYGLRGHLPEDWRNWPVQDDHSTFRARGL